MTQFNAKNLAATLFLGVLLLGVTGIVYAQQQILPKGGDSFETAVKLEPGSYQGGSIESKEAEYFYVTGIKPEQEISVKGTFTADSTNAGAEAVLVLYDKDKTKLAEEIEVTYETVSLTISFPHRGKESDNYYIKAGSGLFDIAFYSLDVSLKAAPAERAGEVAVPEVEGGVPKDVSAEGLNWVLILGGAAIVIVIIGVVVYFLLKKKKTSNEN